MKRIIISIVVLFFCHVSLHAQKGSFNLGFNLGFTIDEASKFPMMAGIEASYLFDLSERIKIGPSLAAFYFYDNNTALSPLSIEMKFNIIDYFFIGGNLGYTFSINSNSKNKFYYRPILGYYITDKTNFGLFYSEVDNIGVKTSSVGLVGVIQF